jgi:hypothetical protein
VVPRSGIAPDSLFRASYSLFAAAETASRDYFELLRGINYSINDLDA